jgi:hypothetical protein
VFDSYGRLYWNPATREPEKIETQHADDNVTGMPHRVSDSPGLSRGIGR